MMVWQGLCENICSLIRAKNVMNLKTISSNLFPKEMNIQLNVFCSWMKFGITCQGCWSCCTLIITPHCWEMDSHKQLQIKQKQNSFTLCVIKIRCVSQINRWKNKSTKPKVKTNHKRHKYYVKTQSGKIHGTVVQYNLPLY